jgi:tetratricopeptide (TPR) repeat protein
MPVIYNITIESTEKENHFHIVWHNPKTNTIDFFDQCAEITPEEIHQLWQLAHHQLPIGEKLFRFLDGDSRHFKRALDQAHQQGESLQVYLRACQQTADWPFELLAENSTFLLPQRLHLVRTVSDWGTEKKVIPKNRPLKLLFMACSALDVQPELDFEQEEEVIFQITEKLAIDMEVEDSGSLEGLHSHLEQKLYDVVHLSGHANINEKGHPYFIMEDKTGHEHQVFPDELWSDALIENPPRLLFLSGCRTGETPDSTGNTAAVSFSRVLVESYNVPAVLGWGRSVSDEQAIHAEKMLFHELCRGKSILDAVQRSRYELLKDFPDSLYPAWSLLRLYNSGIALNAIVKEGQRWQPKPRHMKHVFLRNSQVQVLSEGFVGRRRQMQASLQVLEQDFYKVGVLLLGTGGLGKSCLAGKICERFPDHTLIIVHGKLNAINLGAALADAFIVSQDEKGQQILSQKIDMNKKLANLCATSFKEKNYLLLMDDFDQNLGDVDNWGQQKFLRSPGAVFSKSAPGRRRQEIGFEFRLFPETADLLKTLLHYLPFSGKMTQLIITSRYEFTLTEQNRDLVEERLGKIWLTSFNELEQRKKARELKNILDYPNESLAHQLLREGHGNPLLMEWLDILVGQREKEDVSQLLGAIKDKQEDFIREHVNRLLLQQGDKEFELFLRCFSIYRRPVLEQGAVLVAEKAGIKDWIELLRKGMSLSLLEHDQARQSYQVTPLLQEELLESLEDKKNSHKAAFAYYKKIYESRISFDPLLTEELIFHALGCKEEKVVSEQGGNLVCHLQERLALHESLRGEELILIEKERKYETAIGGETNEGKYPEAAAVLNSLGELWRRLGHPEKTIYYYQEALSMNRAVYGKEHTTAAKGLADLGKVYFDLGQKNKAKTYFEEAYKIFNKLYGPAHAYTVAVTEWLKAH